MIPSTALATLAVLGAAHAPATRAAQQPAAGTSAVAAQVRARLTALFDACAHSRDAAAMPLLAYRGMPRAERYQRAWRPTDPDAARETQGVCVRVRRDLAAGVPVFEAYQERRESEGQWRAWTVRFGATRELFAFVDVQGTLLLGDIDPVR